QRAFHVETAGRERARLDGHEPQSYRPVLPAHDGRGPDSGGAQAGGGYLEETPACDGHLPSPWMVFLRLPAPDGRWCRTSRVAFLNGEARAPAALRLDRKACDAAGAIRDVYAGHA